MLSPPFELLHCLTYRGAGTVEARGETYPIQHGEQLPILFFSGDCHAVRLDINYHGQGRSRRPGHLYMVSMPKERSDHCSVRDEKDASNDDIIQDTSGRRGKIVWKSPPIQNQVTEEKMLIFYPDESKDYFLWYQCGGDSHFIHIGRVMAQWMIWEKEGNNVCKIRQQVYAKCMQWDREMEEEHDEERTLLFSNNYERPLLFSNNYERPELQFLANLFLLALDAIDTSSDSSQDRNIPGKTQHDADCPKLRTLSPFILSFLESKDAGTRRKLDPQLLRAIRKVSAIYLELVERKHPEDDSMAIAPHMKTAAASKANMAPGHLVTCPPILLQDDVGSSPVPDVLSVPKETLHFVTKLPIIPGTIRFKLTGDWDGRCSDDHGSCLLVFAKLSNDHGSMDARMGQSNLHSWSEGDLRLHDGRLLKLVQRISGEVDCTCDVIPSVEGYYLYAFFGQSSLPTIATLELHLTLIDTDDGCTLQAFSRFLGRLNAQAKRLSDESPFHLGLLRAVAATLLECHRQGLTTSKHKALSTLLVSENFVSENFLVDELGLECLQEVLDGVLEYRKNTILPRVVDTNRSKSGYPESIMVM